MGPGSENYYHGGLLRYDMSPKPAYFKLKELIQKRWHTEAELEANENGEVSFRGFFGDYDVEITIGGKAKKQTVSLSRDKDNEFVLSI